MTATTPTRAGRPSNRISPLMPHIAVSLCREARDGSVTAL